MPLNHIFNYSYHVVFPQPFAPQFRPHMPKGLWKLSQMHIHSLICLDPERLRDFLVKTYALLREMRGNVGYGNYLPLAVCDADSI